MDSQESFIKKASGLKAKEYIAYGMGDAGGCMVFGLVTSILQTYYTDVLILSPLFIMIMFVIARLWDAINDPMMGRICDMAKLTRHGRYRVWFIRVAVPLAVSAVLLFLKFPGFGNTDNNLPAYIYATVTYILFGMVYTMLQIPYGSLASVITADVKERSKLSVFRAVGAAAGTLPVMVLQSFCFSKDPVTGASIVKYDVLLVGVIIMAVASMASLMFTFFGTKERVKTEPKPYVKGATANSLKLLFKNKSVVAISMIAMLLLAGQMFTQSYYVYLIRYYFGKGGIYVTLPTILTYIPMMVLMGVAPKLAHKYGKKEVCTFGLIVTAVTNYLMFLLKYMNPDAALNWFMILCLISGFGLNFFVLQMWAMATDAIDDVEVKTGSEDNGTAYSFINFFRKMGQVIAAITVNGALLSMGYYDTASSGSFAFNIDQLNTMYVMATIIPAVMYTLMAIFLVCWYPLSKKRVEELQAEKEAYFKREKS